MDIFRLVVVLFSAILAEVVLTRIALRSVARVNLLRQSSEAINENRMSVDS